MPRELALVRARAGGLAFLARGAASDKRSRSRKGGACIRERSQEALATLRTLVDSQAVVRRTWRRWCERTGVDKAAVLSTAHGRRTMDTLRAIAPHLDVEAEARWLEEAELGDRNGIVPVPGASDLTAALPDASRAIVTSAGRELARRRLE